MTDAADRDREWVMIATVGDPLASAVLAAADPWNAYDAACEYGPFLDDADLPHADGLYVAWAELMDVFETGKTDVSVAHAILRAAALAWLDRPRSPSTEWIERWVRSTRKQCQHSPTLTVTSGAIQAGAPPPTVRADQAGKAPLYVSFWTRFLERLALERPGWSKAKKPQAANWIQMPCPLKGLSYYSASFAQGGKLRSELYVDSDNPDQALDLFNRLADMKGLIEEVYGGSLSWEELPSKRACRIADYSTGDVTDGDSFDEYIDWFFDSGDRLRAAISAALAAGEL